MKILFFLHNFIIMTDYLLEIEVLNKLEILERIVRQDLVLEETIEENIWTCSVQGNFCQEWSLFGEVMYDKDSNSTTIWLEIKPTSSNWVPLYIKSGYVLINISFISTIFLFCLYKCTKVFS